MLSDESLYFELLTGFEEFDPDFFDNEMVESAMLFMFDSEESSYYAVNLLCFYKF
jgi:hypothetical protein